MEGGVDSGFTKVVTNAAGEKRLFHVKGQRNIRIREVDLGIQSMNQNDYFILDSGRKIFIYPPTKTNIFQKTKANEIAKQIRDQDHNGRATVHILDHPISAQDRSEFFSILGCKSNNPSIQVGSEGDDDDAIEMKENATITLYNATTKPGYFSGGASGLLKISTKPLTQDMLKTDVSKANILQQLLFSFVKIICSTVSLFLKSNWQICGILDTGSGIFVWIGKEAIIDDKSHAMVKAQEFIAKLKYPSWTQIHRVVEGAEPVLFKQYFATWREMQPHRINHKRIAGNGMII